MKKTQHSNLIQTDLKLSVQKTKTMALSLRPITSWQIQKEKVEAVTCFILGGFKFTANGDWVLEIQTCLLLGRQAMTKHVKKQ